MNAIVNMFLLAGDKFMPGMHLKPTFTHSACGLITTNKERIKCLKKFKETANQRYI